MSQDALNITRLSKRLERFAQRARTPEDADEIRALARDLELRFTKQNNNFYEALSGAEYDRETREREFREALTQVNTRLDLLQQQMNRSVEDRAEIRRLLESLLTLLHVHDNTMQQAARAAGNLPDEEPADG